MSENIKVLLVDDETGFTDALSRRLTRRGMDVTAVSCADDAVAALDKSGFDVMVLDVKMPGVGGLQLLPLVIRQFPGVEVILLTGHADMKSGITAMSAGAFDFMLKPVDVELLESRITAAARNKLLGTARV